MATEKLKILLDALWKGKSEIQKANKDISKLDDGVGKTKKQFKAMAVAGAAAFAAVAVAAKVAYDTLKEGAALNQAADQFDRLTESIGSTADAMLGRMQEATFGMVSNAQLVAGANEIMLGKLAKTEDAVVRLSSVSGALNWDMGVLAQTINNQSVLRLDNLGLAVEDVIPRFKELKETMSDKEAFSLAVIEAGEKNVELLGEASETTAGQVQILETAVTNAQDALQAGFAAGAAEEVKVLADNVDITTASFNRAGEVWGGLVGALAVNTFGASIAVAELDRALGAGIITQDEYNKKLSQFKRGGQSVGNILGWVSDKQWLWEIAINRTVAGLEDEIAAASSADQVMLQYGGSAAAAAGETTALGNAATVATPKLYQLIQAMGAVSESSVDLADKTRTTTVVTDLMRRKGILNMEMLNDMTSAEDEAAAAAEELSSGIGGVGVAAETAAEKMARLAAETGSFFDQARRSDDFDPAEVFYQSALAAGASAAQLQQLLVGTGLETPERAQEIYNESIQRQLASQAGSAFAGGGNLDMLWQGVQAGVANPQFAAQQVANTTNVGGVSVSIVINGDITGEDLDMTVDNAVASTEAAYGATPGG